MPICVFDIAPDGTATAADATTPKPDGGYRWYHFDLSDLDLPGFLATHVPDIPTAALIEPETRPRCDVFENGLILNLRGVNLNTDGPADQMISVRMWITPDLVVTVRLRKVFAIDAMRQSAMAGRAPATPMGFVGVLSAALMARVRDSVFALSLRVDALEDDILEDTQGIASDFAQKRRMAIRFRRYLVPQRDALLALVTINHDMMSKGQKARLREQANLGKLAVEELDSLVSRMTAIHDHYNAETARQQSRHGYVLSLVATVFLPLGFITGLFGVNVGGMPGVQSDWAFAILCAAMAIQVALAVWALRRLKWL